MHHGQQNGGALSHAFYAFQLFHAGAEYALQRAELLQQKVDAVRIRLSSGASFDEVYAELNSGAAPRVNYISGATTRLSQEYTGAAMSIDTIGGVADSFLAKNKAKTFDAKLARATKWIGAVFLVLTLVLLILA